jgi:hypothetical protein
MIDPLITTLTLLRDRAPSISYTDTSLKSTDAGALAHFASDTPVKFSHGKCQYTVWNTWEHFDYLIRQFKRTKTPKYGTQTSQCFPTFRSRRSAEQGFKVNDTTVSKLKLGSVCLISETNCQLFIVDSLTKTRIHFAPLFEPEHEAYHHAKYNVLTFDLESANDKKVYVPHRPEWFVFESFLTTATIKLLSKFNQELYSTILSHYSHIKRYKSQEKERRIRMEAETKKQAEEFHRQQLKNLQEKHDRETAAA